MAVWRIYKAVGEYANAITTKELTSFTTDNKLVVQSDGTLVFYTGSGADEVIKGVVPGGAYSLMLRQEDGTDAAGD